MVPSWFQATLPFLIPTLPSFPSFTPTLALNYSFRSTASFRECLKVKLVSIWTSKLWSWFWTKSHHCSHYQVRPRSLFLHYLSWSSYLCNPWKDFLGFWFSSMTLKQKPFPRILGSSLPSLGLSFTAHIFLYCCPYLHFLCPFLLLLLEFCTRIYLKKSIEILRVRRKLLKCIKFVPATLWKSLGAEGIMFAPNKRIRWTDIE